VGPLIWIKARDAFIRGLYRPKDSYLVNTVIKESKACILIADKRALFDETNEHLSLGHEGVKLLVWSITTLQKAWKKATSNQATSL